ncbi:MAG: hypothetical protein ACEQSL_01620 [Sediminibacterium sp.]
MRKLIEKSQDSLITCDNPKCDFTIPYSEDMEAYTIIYLNQPCPKCGENLLTEQDYIQHERILKVVNWLNRWFSWTTYLVPKKVWDKRQTVSVHVHDGIKIKNEMDNVQSETE